MADSTFEEACANLARAGKLVQVMAMAADWIVDIDAR